MQEPEANCSESRRLQRLLGRLWQELRGGGGDPDPGASSSPAARPPGENDAYLYILLIMIFYGCLAGGLILAYTRSRKLESKHDPYHLYIERDWNAGQHLLKKTQASKCSRIIRKGLSRDLRIRLNKAGLLNVA
uniref:Potassium voltage-gated channel subfamily E regulatory subunit 5 n=1 Tax=Pseudonaja textilis TaxID=8673 RepID=A0A670XV68_PSETE